MRSIVSDRQVTNLKIWTPIRNVRNWIYPNKGVLDLRKLYNIRNRLLGVNPGESGQDPILGLSWAYMIYSLNGCV